MLDTHAPRGPGLPGITRPTGGRFSTSVRRRAGTGRTPGSVLIAVAAWLLALTGGGALFVSFTAQYTYILAVRRQDAASVIEASLPARRRTTHARGGGRPPVLGRDPRRWIAATAIRQWDSSPSMRSTVSVKP